VLLFLEHALQDARTTATGERRVVSRRMLYVEQDAAGTTRHLQYAPYLDYRPLKLDEPAITTILDRPECGWIGRELEHQALGYAIAQVVPGHLAEVRDRRVEWVTKTRAAVKDRLVKEISYWDHRAADLAAQEQAGKPNAKLNSLEARRRADDLQARLAKRLVQLDLEGQVSALPPVMLGAVVVVPVGLIAKITGREATQTASVDTQAAAAAARAIVMQQERALGFEPTDRETEKLGYDIESRVPGTGRLRFIEVKGRASGADTITVTRNEILYSLNKPDDFILAIVELLPGDQHLLHYLRRPFEHSGITTDFSGASVAFPFADLLARAQIPG
jgi:hypothetical protein